MVIRGNGESGFWPVLTEELSCCLSRWQRFLYFSVHRLVERACENIFFLLHYNFRITLQSFC